MTDTELHKQVKLLKDYTKVLEHQNQTRNEERKHLESQIERLLKKESSGPLSSCQECQQYRLEIRKLSDKIERLEREKANLQSNYDVMSRQTLQRSSESRFVTSTAVTSNLSHTELSSIKARFEESQRECSTLESTVSSLEGALSKINVQLLTLRSQLQTKDSNISKLKTHSVVISSSISKSQYDRVQLEVSTWKSQYEQISRKLAISQSAEHSNTRLETTISELERKLSIISSELYQAKSDVQIKSNEINRLKLDSLPPKKVTSTAVIISAEQENSKLELTSLRYKYDSILSECNELKKRSVISYQSPKEREEREQLQRQVNTLKFELQSSKEEVRRLQSDYEDRSNYELQSKSEEIRRLELHVSSYQTKINEISIQLERQLSATVQTQKNSVTIDSSQQLFLKSEVQRITSINQSLSNQLIAMKKEHVRYLERYQDFERRIRVLEGSNQSLQVELKRSIDIRSQLNVGAYSDSGDMRGVVQELREELAESKELISRIRIENLEMRERLYADGGYDGDRNYSPVKHNYAVEQRIQSRVDTHRKPFGSRTDINSHEQVQLKGRSSKNSSREEQKWNSLQYKINKLKSENNGLKKTLYHMAES